MNHEQQVRQALLDVEQVLKTHQLWQSHAPESQAFSSTEPFCVDTMQPLEWLQWVLLPRMWALLDAGASLPQNFAITPYYEMALEAALPGRIALLVRLTALDALFTRQAD
ncbi:YqcC family protein [Paramixta manurensis]|uniref:YqcC family protein n=1 Tax=Paramixta manurensis TaxID=2740817 RepID=A0A6M8UJ80_9GAMM|nr:YqcC family protein [Erwiniaceae bacterium PD-1]